MNHDMNAERMPRAPRRREAIRAAGTQDLERINAVVEAAIRTWHLPERVHRLSVPALRYDPSDLRHMAFALVEAPDGTARAIAAWERADPVDAPAARTALLLHGIYVVPQAQRAGTGSMLVAHACERALDEKLDGVSVRAWRESEAFFRAVGFQPFTASSLYPLRLFKALQRRSR